MGKNHDHRINHSHNSSHTHSHEHAQAYNGGNILIAFYINFIFALVEVAGGVWTHSIAIQADALHDFGDSLSLFIVWYLQKISARSPSKDYSFGFARFGILGALVTGIILFSGSIYIIIQGVNKFLNPTEVYSNGMIFLAVLGVIINGWAFLRTKNATGIGERMISLHMLEDLWGWVIVLFGGLVIYWKSWYWIDPLLSIFVALFILRNTYRNLEEVFRILLQGTSKYFSIDRLAEVLSYHSVIKSFHHLHIWALHESFHIVTAHLVVVENLKISDIQKIKKEINEDLNHKIGPCECTFEFETELSLCGEDHHKT
jgi:cobalt-zinc-cadmium efflux system protein